MLDDAKINDFGTPSALPKTIVIDGHGIVRAELTPDQTAVTEKSLYRQRYSRCSRRRLRLTDEDCSPRSKR